MTIHIARIAENRNFGAVIIVVIADFQGNKGVTGMSITELLKQHNLTDTVNRYRLQIVHEDNDTYYIEDMKFKRSMTRGQVVHIAKDIPELLRYLKNLRCA